jgi:hypothetical protein
MFGRLAELVSVFKRGMGCLYSLVRGCEVAAGYQVQVGNLQHGNAPYRWVENLMVRAFNHTIDDVFDRFKAFGGIQVFRR